MTRQQVIVSAMGAAHRAHREYAVDPKQRVDVFGVLRQAGAEVFFRPLKSVCGAYLPTEGPVPAMLINSNLPLSRQRFTAAHELGHVFMGHKAVSLDFETGIVIEDRKEMDVDEIAAESFAAFFLMPKALMMSSLRDLDLIGKPLNPGDVYLLALKMGTSYLATINQLHVQKLLTWPDVKKLKLVPPKLIKQKINDESVGRHDVWLLDEHWNGQAIFPAPEDTVRITLNETPSSGYCWLWRSQPSSLALLDDRYEEPDPASIGGTGVRELVAQVRSDAQRETISISRRRAWEPAGQSSGDFQVTLIPQELRRSGPLLLPRLA